MQRTFIGLLAVAFLSLSACGDDAVRRPIGSTCTASTSCESGVCGGGQCLDPARDEDLDGLINELESKLGSDPLRADTDGDGVSDRDELEAGQRGDRRQRW